MTTERRPAAALRAMLTENLGLKLVSLLCAVLIYAFIHGADNEQVTFSVGVVALMPPDSAKRVLLTPLPTEVGVTLRGARTQIDDLKSTEVGALRLDLRDARDGRVELTPGMIRVPAGITVDQITPSYVDVKWDDVVTRSIPVQVPRTGEPAAGCMVKSTRSEPATIVARGPRTVVNVLQFARAAPFDVSGLTEGAHMHALALDKPPGNVTFDVETVNGIVDVAPELKQRQFAKLKVEVVGAPKAKVKPATVEVDVVGTAEELNDIVPEAVVPRVEPKAAGLDLTKPGSAMLDVLVDVPRVKLEVKPAKVLVTW